MSSTRFDPPVPLLEEVTGIGDTTVPDRDGIIEPGGNDYSSSRNKRTLRSYISSLTKGSIPTEGVVEYNGQLPPNHANPFPVTPEVPQPQFTDQAGLRDAVDLAHEPSPTLGDTSEMVSTGPLGKASSSVEGTGHELLAGIVGDRDRTGNTVTTTEGAKKYAKTLGESLGLQNLNSGPTVVDNEKITSDRRFIGEAGSFSGKRTRLGSDSLGNSYNVASDKLTSPADLTEIGKRLMIRAMGSNPDEEESKWITGPLSSARVPSSEIRVAVAADGTSLADLNRTMVNQGEDALIVDDEIGNSNGTYTGESWPTTLSPDTPYTGPTTGQAAFGAFVTNGAFVGSVLAAAAIGSVIPPIAPASVPAEVNSGLRNLRKLKSGEFRYEPADAGLSLVTQGLDALSDVTGLTLQNPIYVPTNPLVGYGDCVVAGLAYFLGVTIGIDPDLIVRSGAAGIGVASANGNSAILLAAITIRLAVIYADPTSRQYYMGVIREINRDTVALGGQIGEGLQVVGNAALDVLGVGTTTSIFDSKLFKFVNTLAKIGDIAYAQAAAIEYRGTNTEMNPADAYASFDYEVDKKSKINARGFGARRIRGDRLTGYRGGTLSLTDLPSTHLVPDGKGQSYVSLIGSEGAGGRITSVKPSTTLAGRKRFSPEQVKAVESVLDAEYMPFYFQDLRTNEIVSFHAFLEDINDSYSAEYNSTSGYGRIEDIKTYKGTKRSVSCTFQVVSMNPQDFDYMWWQINKLTSMVYPQWSKGRDLQTNDGFKFTQPFSQIPTATPVIRVRVGDLIRSNYSRFNLKRLFGREDVDKSQSEAGGLEATTTSNAIEQPGTEVLRLKVSGDTVFIEYVNFTQERQLYLPVRDNGVAVKKRSELFNTDFLLYEILEGEGAGKTIKVFNNEKVVYRDLSGLTSKRTTTTTFTTTTDVDNFYDPANNAIVRAFESTAGMGLASVVTQLQFTWMDNTTTWGAGEDGPGNRAPRSCKVQMTFEPIHDIAPGLDHEGFNRAPIYPVGDLINSIVEGGESEPYGPGSQQMVSLRGEIENDVSTYTKNNKPGIISKLF